MSEKLVEIKTTPSSAKALMTIDKLWVVNDDLENAAITFEGKDEPWIFDFDENQEYVVVLKAVIPTATKVVVEVGGSGLSEFTANADGFVSGIRHV